MPIIENVELHWVRLNPKSPNTSVNGQKIDPRWELQMQTKSKEKRDEIKGHGFKIGIVETDDGVSYKANIQKNTHSRSGEPNKPVEVVDRHLNPLNPSTIGNGSIGNVRFMAPTGSTAKILLAVQVIELVKYDGGTPESFKSYDEDSSEGFKAASTPAKAPSSTPYQAPVAPATARGDDAF